MMEVSVPRLIGSATAGTAPGALCFEVEVRPVHGDAYSLQRKYREFTAMQADLVRDGIIQPVLVPASKSASVESRRESAEQLLKRGNADHTTPACPGCVPCLTCDCGLRQ